MKTEEQILKLIDGESTVIDGYMVKILADDDPSNPRKEFDNAGKMVCWHSRYSLGDEQPDQSPSEFYDEILKPIEQAGGIVLPLYLLDHSGITISTSGFSCPWDSGQVGYIYIDADTIRKEWGAAQNDAMERARECLISEVETYDQYLTGDVWGYVIEKDGEHIDSCWRFYGAEYCKQEAASVLAHVLEREHKERQEKLKTYIRHHVPLKARTL